MFPTQAYDDYVTPPPPRADFRPNTRSRYGCLSCKRRKVKCNEQRPLCSNCIRLHLECQWDLSPLPGQQISSDGEFSSGTVESRPDPSIEVRYAYTSFVWDTATGDWQERTSDSGDIAGPGVDAPRTRAPEAYMARQPEPAAAPWNAQVDPRLVQSHEDYSDMPNLETLTDKLIKFFLKLSNPPIFAGVEPQRTWKGIRPTLVSKAKSSRVLWFAMLAFSNSLISKRDANWDVTEHQGRYDEAVAEMAAYDSESLEKHSPKRECFLAALFLLSHIDIQEIRLEEAHKHLKRAYKTFQRGTKGSFSEFEEQILAWIRILDARVVSAGGKGLFLSKNDEIHLKGVPRPQDVADDDIADVLIQALYTPGILFYRRILSFMGRVSNMYPWDSSAGMMVDETRGTDMGASLAADLRALYEERPLMMDYAIAGTLLLEPHLSEYLVVDVTRAFRTYLSNYYASKIHLHRIAYKSWPLTMDAIDALNKIRNLAHQISGDQDSDDSLPVNMLWPLLMLGVEERDEEERAWIKAQILRIDYETRNARIIAQVLDEVQTQQWIAGARVDEERLGAITHSKKREEDFETTLRSVRQDPGTLPDSSPGYQPTTYKDKDRSPLTCATKRPRRDTQCTTQRHVRRKDSLTSSDDEPSTKPPDSSAPAPLPWLFRDRQGKGTQTSSKDKRPPSYCTQKCLLGLTSGGFLDPACPNVEHHNKEIQPVNDHGLGRHPVDYKKWLGLLWNQLKMSLDDGIQPLAPGSARGVLFRVTLLAYGYTFVAKGTVKALAKFLEYEATVYRRLEPIQGINVPVYLGSFDLRDMNKILRCYNMYSTRLG
ncbi:Meiotic driver SPOK3 [Cladobotryum mycophilum]|uniref:Meiotic driver SPOK3 n=1 Tax=Cladobotryum mycophilum TaxID=491253 RepID=A0ABR0SPP1_9HYPO